jgi:hypothetical protein
MKNKRLLAASVAVLAAFSLIGMTAVALAYPTSSHSGGANANQTGVVRIDPTNPQVVTFPAGTTARPARKRTCSCR